MYKNTKSTKSLLLKAIKLHQIFIRKSNKNKNRRDKRMKIEQIENGIKVTIPEKENYTLDELKQNLINILSTSKLCYCEKEIELLNIILNYEVELKKD